jgi:hypothetical protein
MFAGVLARTMNIPDQDIVLTVIEDARRILGEYIALGPRDATGTGTALDRDEVCPRTRSNEKAPDPPPCGNGPPGSARRPDARRCRTTYAGPNQKTQPGNAWGCFLKPCQLGGRLARRANWERSKSFL